tara:strand:+ start:7794 stop:8006 length:213 start_codon:yes stop_codon:yes gene_type:complete
MLLIHVGFQYRVKSKETISWQETWTSVASEFSGIPDLSNMTRIVLRVVLTNIAWRYRPIIQLDSLMEGSQ